MSDWLIRLGGWRKLPDRQLHQALWQMPFLVTVFGLNVLLRVSDQDAWLLPWWAWVVIFSFMTLLFSVFSVGAFLENRRRQRAHLETR